MAAPSAPNDEEKDASRLSPSMCRVPGCDWAARGHAHFRPTGTYIPICENHGEWVVTQGRWNYVRANILTDPADRW